MDSCGCFPSPCRRASLGKTHHLPISRPDPLQVGAPDIRSRSHSPARPPSQSHLAGSLCATYMGSASCFLRTPRFRVCPCLVGVILPSGNGGCFTSGLRRKVGLCVMPGARIAAGGEPRRYNPSLCHYFFPVTPRVPRGQSLLPLALLFLLCSAFLRVLRGLRGQFLFAFDLFSLFSASSASGCGVCFLPLMLLCTSVPLLNQYGCRRRRPAPSPLSIVPDLRQKERPPGDHRTGAGNSPRAPGHEPGRGVLPSCRFP